MKEYICVVTSELGKMEDDFVVSTTLHRSSLEAIAYGREAVVELAAYPACADFWIYKIQTPKSCPCLDDIIGKKR